MRVVAYTRVSTQEQAEHGHSLGAQQAKIESYCDLYDLELVKVVADAGFSGKSLDRPGIQKALEMLKSGKVDGLIVTKLDRLTRDTHDLAGLVKTYFQKAALLSVSEQIDTRGATGKFMLNLLGSLAQLERDQIAERTRAALSHMKSQSLRTGHIPFGYRLAADSKHIKPDAIEQEILKLIGELKAAGLSTRKLADHLNSNTAYRNRGKVWNQRSVDRVFKAAA